jgi:hypothetical protein
MKTDENLPSRLVALELVKTRNCRMSKDKFSDFFIFSKAFIHQKVNSIFDNSSASSENIDGNSYCDKWINPCQICKFHNN